MTFTPVIPTNYQTNRQDLQAALVAIVDAFIASASYACGRMFKTEVPDSFTGEGPLIILGDINETITHDWQIRRTVFSGSLFYVDWLTDRAETNDRVNVWADKMRDLFTFNKSTVNPDCVLEQTGFQEGEFTQGQLYFTAPSLTFTYTVQEGYQ